MKPDVFISYAHTDQKKAEAIAHFLERQGIRCWLDRTGLRLAESYDAKITQALRDCRAVLWLASNASLQSDYVRHEISSALAHGKPIGPVFLESVDRQLLKPPFDLSETRVHGIEYFREPVEENLATLLDDLRPLVRPRKRARIAAAGAALLMLGVILTVPYWPNGHETGLEPVPAHDLPDGITSLPAGNALQVAYTGAPPAPKALLAPPQLELAMLARRQGEKTFRPLEDGDAMASRVDDYAIVARAHTHGYLYIFQVDVSGKTEWLFPHNDQSAFAYGTNPVRPGQIIRIPAGEKDNVLFLDQTTGVEHVYAAFSATRWPELEQTLLGQDSSLNTAYPSQGGGALIALNVATPNGLRLRGVGGTRVNTSLVPVNTRLDKVKTNKADAYFPTGLFYEASSWFLVVERWFIHVN